MECIATLHYWKETPPPPPSARASAGGASGRGLAFAIGSTKCRTSCGDFKLKLVHNKVASTGFMGCVEGVCRSSPLASKSMNR